MISQTVEYSLRAIVTLAQRHGQALTARDIAQITKVPAPYLSKLMRGLVRTGLVRSQRGLHGGFLLGRSPEEISVWDVVEAVDPLKRIRGCPLKLESHSQSLCPLHRRLDDALELVERSFRQTYLAEILRDPASITPLCDDGRPVMSLSSPRGD